MGIIKKVLEKSMFFGAKTELFCIPLSPRERGTEGVRH
jgi:hypothetical protein